MKTISKFLSVLLLVCSLALVFSACDKKYKLTVEGPVDHLKEKLKNRYAAGETVTVKTGILFDAGINVYLDGEKLKQEDVKGEDGIYSHWEYTFTMPEHNAILRIEVYDGWGAGILSPQP